MAGTLQTALSGLRISQQQINVISGNVSNVGTPGYTRKLLPQETQSINGETIGVLPGTILRNVDMNLTRNLWTQISSSNELAVQETYLKRVEQFHGPPDAGFSIAAKVSELRDSFSSLADSPDDPFLLASTVNEAIDMAEKINDLSNFITELQNNVQDEMETTVSRINGILEQIAELNDQIKTNTNLGRTTATLEDGRDEAIKELTSLIDISFFIRGDGAMVVQTNEGVELAGDVAQELYFNPTPLAATTYYPDSVAGIYVDNPNTNPQATDITTRGIGGKLGGLITLRDTTFPKQMAQLDELAHKMASRFDAQGLRLFTDGTGSIPADTAPDATTLPNPTAVEYVGFSASIQVNSAIISDNTLLQTGTYGATLEAGSNEIISRVIENTFGSISHQQISNSDTTTQVDLLNRGGDDLQTWLGLFSSNSMQGARDLTAYANVGDIITLANGQLDPPNDTFVINIEEARTGLGPMSLTVDISDADLAAGANAAEQMANYIDGLIATAVGGTPAFAGLAADASVGSNGELIITTRGSYEIDSTAGIAQTGLNFFGLADNNGSPVSPTDPYFDIQVGNNLVTRITIEPSDTDVELLAKLDAVPGLAIDTTNFALDGLLNLRPGDDFDNPDFGGEIRITSSGFTTSGASYGSPPATTGTRASIDNGANVVSALFGTYTDLGGGVIQDDSPITDMEYASETDGSLAPNSPTLPFRQTLLGPGANISTQVIGSTTLIDFSQKIINEQSQEIILLNSRKEDEEALQDLLQTQLNNESGVNLDEELGNLVVMQTAYSASARVLTVVDELFQELLSVI